MLSQARTRENEHKVHKVGPLPCVKIITTKELERKIGVFLAQKKIYMVFPIHGTSTVGFIDLGNASQLSIGKQLILS